MTEDIESRVNELERLMEYVKTFGPLAQWIEQVDRGRAEEAAIDAQRRGRRNG